MRSLIILLAVICSAPLLAQDTVRAIILDQLTKEPIPGALVVMLDKDSTVIGKQITKASGAFAFRERGSRLHISSLGYNDTIIYIDNVSATLLLTPSFSSRQEVVVTAQRHVTLAQDVPVSISIVRPKEVASRSPQTVDQVFRFIPGVTVTEDQVSIRGSSGYARAVGSRVLMLLDGVPFISADNGDIKFDAIPLLNIERVEVVKGPGSALYGSSALGGIINVITREPTDRFHGAVNTFAGFYDDPQYPSWRVFDDKRRFAAVELGASGTLDAGIGLLGSMAYRRNEGYRLGDDYIKWSGFGKSVFPVTDATRITLSGLYAHDDHGGWLYWRDLSNPLRPNDSLTAINARITSKKAHAALTMRSFLSDQSTFTGRGSILHTSFTTAPRRPGESAGAHSSADGYTLDLELSTSAASPVFLTSGISGTYQTVSSDLFQSHDGLLFGAFAQGEYKLGPTLITVGARADGIKYDTMDIAGRISPKVGVSLRITDALKLRASFGTGFRAPTMSEQFTDQVLNGFTIKPNHSLKPEKSSSLEFGGGFDSKWMRADGAVFYSLFNDLIEPGFVTTSGAPYIQFRNVTNAEIFGHEESIEFFPFGHDSLSIRAAYTYIYPHDKSLKRILNFRPRHLLQIRLAALVDHVDLSTDFRYISKYESVDPTLITQVPNGDARVPAYILDARVGYDFRNMSLPVKLVFQVQNLLNYYYVEIVGNMAPLRNYTLRLESTF